MKWFNKLKGPWGTLRILRLVLVIFFVTEAIQSQTWWLLGIALWLSYQVVANTACASCETGVCETDHEPVKTSGSSS